MSHFLVHGQERFTSGEFGCCRLLLVVDWRTASTLISRTLVITAAAGTLHSAFAQAGDGPKATKIKKMDVHDDGTNETVVSVDH